jgi:iron complex transport system ATP-binding protein
MPDEILQVRNLTARYGSRVVFREISFSLARGTLAALVGPNGSGKTTLLHAICGIHPEWEGDVAFGGQAIAGLSRREIARRIALVPQSAQTGFQVTVAETIALGRYPWLGPLAPLGPGDQAAIDRAIEALDLGELRQRPLQTLSGGERQRVFLARALAQETPLLLLDEPAASLDLHYQQEIFARLRSLAADRNVAILVADHHLNLVAAACDRLLVLHEGRLWADGPPAEIVTEEMIRTVFKARMRVQREDGGRPQCVWEF